MCNLPDVVFIKHIESLIDDCECFDATPVFETYNENDEIHKKYFSSDICEEEMKKAIIKAKIEVIEKVESFSNGVSMLNFKEILKGYAGAIKDLDT